VKLSRVVGVVVGSLMVAVWLPLLLDGLASLRSRGPLGESDELIVTGAYARVRHPLYAGLCFTIAGVGLVLGSRWITFGGLGWLAVTQLWSVHEEAELARSFGARYEEYRRATPRLVPRGRRPHTREIRHSR
jgi:protein-S-isoprenylcysteine O-methyltransferase Ste14